MTELNSNIHEFLSNPAHTNLEIKDGVILAVPGGGKIQTAAVMALGEMAKGNSIESLALEGLQLQIKTFNIASGGIGAFFLSLVPCCRRSRKVPISMAVELYNWCEMAKSTKEYAGRIAASILLKEAYIKRDRAISLNDLGLTSVPPCLDQLSDLDDINLKGNTIVSAVIALPTPAESVTSPVLLPLEVSRYSEVSEEIERTASSETLPILISAVSPGVRIEGASDISGLFTLFNESDVIASRKLPRESEHRFEGIIFPELRREDEESRRGAIPRVRTAAASAQLIEEKGGHLELRTTQNGYTDDIKNDLIRASFTPVVSFTATLADVKKRILENGPVILGLPGHAIIIDGIEGDQVILRDPFDGWEFIIKKEALEKVWSSKMAIQIKR